MKAEMEGYLAPLFFDQRGIALDNHNYTVPAVKNI